MKNIEVVKQTIRLKPFSLTQLAKFYGCSLKTMRTWLKPIEKEIGPRTGYFFTPKQVRIIFEELGVPGDATTA